MNANELRIGNFYMFADNDGIVYRGVKEIKHNQFGFESDYDGVNFGICRPIPLTIHWLIRFGVNEVKNQDVLRINYVKYYKSENKFEYCLCFFFD